jgi:UDP-glucose 4-epimerase
VRRVVLVTGVARPLGARLAERIRQDPSVDGVVGVDVVAPPGRLDGIDFVRADVRNPVIAKVIAQSAVDTVVHLGVQSRPGSGGRRAAMKEMNVIGTMQLLAACQKARSVRKLVVKSSTAVYGASPKDPAMYTEELEPHSPPRSGFGKDSAEVEGYVRGFVRRRSDVVVTVLRFATLLGPWLESPMSAYFDLPLVPTVLGFDPRLQFLHPDDALDCLVEAVVSDHPGTFNVAGDGVLLLSQAIRRSGRPQVALPRALVPVVGSAVAAGRSVDFSDEQLRYLTYGRVADVSLMRSTLGFAPGYSTAETLTDYLARSESVRDAFGSGTVAFVEERVRGRVGTAGTGRG